LRGLIISNTGQPKANEFAIWGGYGGHNLGDEAILWALSRQLRRLDPAARLYVLVPKTITPQATEQYKDWQIEIVNGSLKNSIRILRRARLIVGGGQLVDDISLGWPTGITSLFLIINWLCGNRPLILCIGAERLTRFLPKLLVKYVYGLATLCACRDSESAEVVREAGINGKKVIATRDVVFSLERKLLPPRRDSRPDSRPRIVLVVAYDATRFRVSTDSSVALIDGLVQLGYRVDLIAHDLRAEYDMCALAEIEERYSSNSSVRSPRPQSAEQAFSAYSRADAVISGRMHPLIMASLAGSLPIAFGGRAKVKALTRSSGIPSLTHDVAEKQLCQIEQLLAEKTPLLSQIGSFVDSCRIDVEDSIARALAL
jgi:polysaccharide pyruvyl transferase WcaK-like protein